MDITQLALTWVGRPNGQKLALICANFISTKVSLSQRKVHAWPGQTESQVDQSLTHGNKGLHTKLANFYRDGASLASWSRKRCKSELLAFSDYQVEEVEKPTVHSMIRWWESLPSTTVVLKLALVACNNPIYWGLLNIFSNKQVAKPAKYTCHQWTDTGTDNIKRLLQTYAGFDPPSISHKLMIRPLFFLQEHWSSFWQTSATLCTNRKQETRKVFIVFEDISSPSKHCMILWPPIRNIQQPKIKY